jgi:hypothetical protein
MCTDRPKMGPSGMSHNEAFSLSESWGGQNCLLPVDVDVICEIEAEMGGDALLNFVSDEFAAQCQAVYDGLHISELTLANIWQVFIVMLPLVYP